MDFPTCLFPTPGPLTRAVLPSPSVQTHRHMSDDIRNAGLKGWIFAGFFISLLLFVALCVYIYQANYVGLAQ